jgi:phosphate uptake regulator
MQELETRLRSMGETVQQQLADALAAFASGDTSSAELVIERDDIVDISRSSLEERCFRALRETSTVLEERRVRSALRVIQNLERIGDAASHIAKHCLMRVNEGDEVIDVPLEDLAKIALAGLDEALGSFFESDLDLAQRACEREPELDAIYVRRIEEIGQLIDRGETRGRRVLHELAVLKYLEKVGDFVLNIGETTVHAMTGTRLSYPQFEELRELLPKDGESNGVYRHFWDGISGATVLEVGRHQGKRLVFKEGTGQKIEDEFHKSIEWEGIAPGHTAHIIGIARAKGRNGILREFAEGSLLLDVLLSDARAQTKEAAMRQVTEVLTNIWSTTIIPRPAQIDYTDQIRDRLRDVLRRHPHLERVAKEQLADFGGLYDTLSLLAARESWLRPPFSIWIHGDLNANNIVADLGTNSVVFIDVHRSKYGDYLQDVAVLATSALRKFPRGKIAKGVRRANEVLLQAAEDFAETNQDPYYKVRLRLARARALMTSTRLELEPERAERLFVEGLDLLRKVGRALKIGKKD